MTAELASEAKQPPIAGQILVFLALLCSITRASLNKIEVPFLTGPVVDDAGLLSQSDDAEVAALVEKLNASGKIQMAVLIPRSLQGNDIETYSIAVAEKWKLGKKGEDRGLIFIVAPNERKMRIEVGYGLEGEITDAHSRRILDLSVAPYFKEGRYRDGFLMGIEGIAHRIGVDLEAPVTERIPEQQNMGNLGLLIVAAIFLFIFFLASLMTPHRRRYYGGGWWGGGWGGGGFGGGGGWGGGGGFGGGGFSGGGGGFGGGGSSSSW